MFISNVLVFLRSISGYVYNAFGFPFKLENKEIDFCFAEIKMISSWSGNWDVESTARCLRP